jgi:hypothetical protein
MKVSVGRFVRLALGVIVAVGSSRMNAQVVLGTISEARVLPLREQLEAEMKLSKFRLGPIRLRPRLSLQGPTYTNNLTGTPGEAAPDWTATAVGGLRYIIPIGTRTFVRGEASPSYFWALNDKERRRFGWINDATLYAFLGRVTIEATGGFNRDTTPLSSEDIQPVGITSTRFGLRSELETFRKLSLLGEVRGIRRSYDTAGVSQTSAAEISKLEGNDLSIGLGLRYRYSSSLMLAAIYERSTFRLPKASERDDDETGYVFSVQFQRRRLALNALGGLREFRAAGNYSFPTYRGTTGALFLAYELLRPLTLETHATRNLVGSLYLDNPYFVETRYGAGLALKLGRRIDLRGIFEIGTNSYPLASVTGADVPIARKDDVKVLRGELWVQVLRSVRILGGLSQTRYTSNIPGLDRSILAFTSTVDFGGSDLIR